MERRIHIISALVLHKPGVLQRVAGLFTRRGFNIENITVGTSEQDNMARMTIIARGDDRPELAVGPIANLDLTAGGSNLVNLWVKDGTANLYVNNQWITALDVSEKIVAGDAAVCTGFYTGYEIEGKITRYEGFEVSELP